MILLWGVPAESPLAAVRAALEAQGEPVFLLDQRDVLSTEVELTVGPGLRGVLRAPNGTLELATVTAAYLRPYDTVDVAAVAQAGLGSDAWRHALAVEEALWLWAELAPALVVNRPCASASNGSKPYQLDLIRRAGFRVPETLLTTDPAAALAFWERHQAVVYKSVSGVRSIVARLQPEHLQRLDNVRHCPTQFQQYVGGTDYRVHVVGAELFVCSVRSTATDYRYADDAAVDIEACSLPPEVTERCRRLAAALELAVTGIDLRRGLDGEWYCFEANPSPAFPYYEAAAGLPIARAIARLLGTGRASARLAAGVSQQQPAMPLLVAGAAP